MRGDLHTHTRASDGSLFEHQILKLAKRSNVDCVAITNHDYITPIENIKTVANELGITLIDGVEISAFDTKRNRRVHILCYMPKHLELIKTICDRTTGNRTKAGVGMAKKVSELYPITVDDINEIAKHSKCIYKQHIMKVLMNAGFTTGIFGDLFDELFSFDGGTCIINCKQPDVYEVIDAVKKSGGICVMAHPYTYKSIDLLDELIQNNLLDGVEVWSSKSSIAQEEYLLNIVNEHNLISTGGSDFHGAYSSRISPIGSKTTPEKSINALFELKNKLHSEV